MSYTGLIGLAISYALSMTSMLSNVLNSFTETEREMIAVERCREYLKVCLILLKYCQNPNHNYFHVSVKRTKNMYSCEKKK